MIVVFVDTIYKNGKARLEISHGIHAYTMRHVELPPCHPAELGAHYSPVLGSWILTDYFEEDENEDSNDERPSP
jgi:hypothetical protein